MSTACWIYKGDKREETYLYVEREGDFEKVPAPLLSAMGSLKLVMAIELDAHRTLARADVKKVIEDLHQCGFYLQMPPHKTPITRPNNNWRRASSRIAWMTHETYQTEWLTKTA